MSDIKLHLESFYDHFTRYRKPKYIKWTKEETNLSVYTDSFVWGNVKENSIALILEPRSIQADVCDSMKDNYRKFEHVFTHDSYLLDKLPNALPIYFGGVWSVKPREKTKAISMPCSVKMMCPMHRIRHQVADYCKRAGKADTFGRFDGGSYAKDSKIYEPYMFTIAIENYIDDIYFTEKICNAIAAKTIPIYWGAKDIGKIFDMDGIIQVKSLREILDIIDNYSLEDYRREYEARKAAVDKNFEIVKRFRCFDDWLYMNYGELLHQMNGDEGNV